MISLIYYFNNTKKLLNILNIIIAMNNQKQQEQTASFISKYTKQLSIKLLSYTLIGSFTTLLLFRKPKIGGVIGMGMAFGICHSMLTEQTKNYLKHVKISLH